MWILGAHLEVGFGFVNAHYHPRIKEPSTRKMGVEIRATVKRVSESCLDVAVRRYIRPVT